MEVKLNTFISKVVQLQTMVSIRGKAWWGIEMAAGHSVTVHNNQPCKYVTTETMPKNKFTATQITGPQS
jgi:hypothetical protein